MTTLTIKQARAGLGWTQEQLAHELSISRRTLVRYEQGHISSTMLKLVKLVIQNEIKRRK